MIVQRYKTYNWYLIHDPYLNQLNYNHNNIATATVFDAIQESRNLINWCKNEFGKPSIKRWTHGLLSLNKDNRQVFGYDKFTYYSKVGPFFMFRSEQDAIWFELCWCK
jgi:hypothetical protein